MPKICPVCGTSYPDSNIFCAKDGTTLRAADADGDLIGSVIADRYLVTDLLGEGGMGKVYLARHVRLPQQAAIKVLRPDQVRDASAIARFNSEAANASQINHDRVARVYDFGETGEGIVYLAMEYVAGKTLKALLAGGPLPPRRAAALVRQIADGLDAAHRMGIVHRDLKPDNVLVIEGEASDGSDDRVKVVDFGIAKAFGAEATGSGLTRTGFVVGTPEYMSPEQLLGAPIDARSDVYALALVAYNLLTADLPFDLNTPDRGLTARLTQDPRPLAAVQPAIPWSAELQGVFSRTLARLPDERPASAGAFARELSAAVDSWEARPLVSPDHTAAAASLRATPAIPTSAVAPAATAAAPIGPIVAPATAAPGAAPHTPAAATTGRGRMGLIGAGVGLAVVVGIGAVVLVRRGSAPADASTTAAPTTAINTAAPPSATPSTPTVVTPATSGAVTTAAGTGTTAPAGPPARTPVTTTQAASAAPTTRVPATRSAADVPPTASPTTTPAPVAARPAPAAGNARHTLDSLTTAFDPSSADAASGRAAMSVVRGLLPRLTTGDDSASAYIRLIEANLVTNDQRGACAALRSAHAVARAPGRREALKNYDGVLSCQ